jgi:hypothetical protein
MSALATAAVALVLATAAAVASVCVGILLGRRLDGIMEARASRGSGAGEEVGSDD